MASLALEESKKADERDMQPMLDAKAVLDNNIALQAVHSTRSVTALIKTAVENKPSDAQPKILNEPRIVLHDPYENIHLKQRESVSNLPYLHRNPAV